jgi:hypothetical protein
MASDWRDLQIGDRIRFFRMPPVFSRPGYHIAPETTALYELLISTSAAIEIEYFDDAGFPVACFVDRRNTVTPVFHSLVIWEEDNDSWEFVV